MSDAAENAVDEGVEVLRRNDVVRIFGTPDETIGSVNEPRLQEENGVEYNEKWVYHRPAREPTKPKARVIYWQRYDFQASFRTERDGHQVSESPQELLARTPAAH